MDTKSNPYAELGAGTPQQDAKPPVPPKVRHKWKLRDQSHEAEKSICLGCGIVKLTTKRRNAFPLVRFRHPDGRVTEGVVPECSR